MAKHPVYPSLWRAADTKYVDTPCIIDGKKVWQQCFVCGKVITFLKDFGRWQTIGCTLIRHKDCEPLPYGGLK